MSTNAMRETLRQAFQHHEAGHWPQAEALYRKVLAHNPGEVEALFYLGRGLAYLGQHEEAFDCLRQTIALNPNLAEAHHLVGQLFQAAGRWEDAGTSYRNALALRPDSAITYSNLGTVLHNRGFVDEAIASLRKALTLQPSLAAAHNNLGVILRERGQLAEATESFQYALALKPDLAATHNNLGLVFKDQGRLDEALSCFQRALTLQPELADAHHNIGLVLKEQDFLDEALMCYQQALALQPRFAIAHNNLGNALKDAGRLDEALASFRRAVELAPTFIEAHSNLVYSLAFQPGVDAETLRAELDLWARHHAAPLARSIRPHANERTPNRRLRIGYVSPNFNDHCQAFFMVPLLAAHDPTAYEIHLYASVRSPDALTERLRRNVDAWHDVLPLSDKQLAEKIRADEIDILVDLTMHMAQHRLLTFACKPAPVQISWLAYPGSTGLKAIDYRLTDPFLDPPERSDSCYAETSIRLPHTFWCYDPLTSQPPVNTLPAFTCGHVTFGCLNNFCKVNDAVLGLWARVLQAVQDSRLLLLCPEGNHIQRTRAWLKAEGITPDRIEFLGRRPRAQYLELYHRIDVCLDTFPYNGHTTSLDSYWMGVPVITLVGTTIVGRAGWSQLSNLGLTELATHTPDEFVRVATQLANDLPRLAGLRATLRERMQQSPLMDAPLFARAFEAACRRGWENWCASRRVHP